MFDMSIFNPGKIKCKIAEISLPCNYLNYYKNYVSHFPFPFILDSSIISKKYGRYTFMGSSPFLVLASKREEISILSDNGKLKTNGNPFDIIKKLLSLYKIRPDNNIPFSCGMVGYIGYDLCHFMEKLPQTQKDDIDLPDLFFGVYDKIIAIDHIKRKTFSITLDWQKPKKNIKIFSQMTSPLKKNNIQTGLSSNFTKTEYLSAIKKIKRYIAAGDVYQVNLSQRFHTSSNLPHIEIFERLRKSSPAYFSSLIELPGNKSIISSSPELFLKVDGRKIMTRPIKGTEKRGGNETEDKILGEGLFSSEKNNAELAMIVDVERNDLGKVCEFGSVKVTQPKALETYTTLHHLVATVKGRIRKSIDVVDILAATFPSGSITGAPKIRAMEIIDEIEPTRRSVYTGAIGYISFDSKMLLSIAIRIIIADGNDILFQVGGGIVVDSDPESEYQETLVKALGITNALKT